MRLLGALLFGTAFFVTAFGCNQILENEPGRLDRGGTSATGESSETPADQSTAPGGGNGAAPIRGEGGGTNGSEEDGDATPSDAGITCTEGSKACGELCVSLVDPFFGCSAPSCASCVVPHATAACVLGTCGISACVPGFADCNALPIDGCETDIQTVNDCGACGIQCPVLPNVAMACLGGACTGACAAGFGDCNADVADGCEVDLLTDRKNCGACGTRCVFGRCEQGVCSWP